MISSGGGYQPKANGAPSSPPTNPPNRGSAGKNERDAREDAVRSVMDRRLVRKPAPERPKIEALVNAARGRPTEPEGAEAALGRFLANWRNRGRQDTDGVFARADFWHSVANVPVELLRELGVPKPKAAGKALLVLVPLGLACAVLAAMAAIVLAVLVAL